VIDSTPDWSLLRQYRYSPAAPHAVYWLTNVDGEIIYIGSSYHPELRIAQHHKKSWGMEIHTNRFDWYENEAVAFASEVAAIRKHQPRHNRAYTNNTSPSSDPPSKGTTPSRPIRIDNELWKRFGRSVILSGDRDRSTVIRDFMRWYVKESGAPRPTRAREVY